MKLALGLMGMALGLSLNAVAAADATYDMSGNDACILQIMKEVSPSFVIACGSKTEVNNPIQAYSAMQNPTLFQAESKKIFLSRLTSTAGVKCNEYDNSTVYLLICNKP